MVIDEKKVLGIMRSDSYWTTKGIALKSNHSEQGTRQFLKRLEMKGTIFHIINGREWLWKKVNKNER